MKRKWLKADRETKDRKRCLYGYFSQPLNMSSLVYCTLFKVKQRCPGSFSSPSARKIAGLLSLSRGEEFWLPSPRACYAKLVWLEWGEQVEENAPPDSGNEENSWQLAMCSSQITAVCDAARCILKESRNKTRRERENKTTCTIFWSKLKSFLGLGFPTP